MTFMIDKNKTKFLMGIADVNQLSDWLAKFPDIIGLCTAGRSNVGKSTLINSLFGNNVAKTSKNPGKTKEINIFSFQLKDLSPALKSSEEVSKGRNPNETFYLFDLPGHGHANVSKAQAKVWNELLFLFFQNISPHLLIFNVQDCRHPHMPSDQQFSSFIAPFNFPSFLVFNKLDKLKTQKELAALEKVKKQLLAKYKWVKEMHFVSAQKGEGIETLNQSLISQLFLFQMLKDQ